MISINNIQIKPKEILAVILSVKKPGDEVLDLEIKLSSSELNLDSAESLFTQAFPYSDKQKSYTGLSDVIDDMREKGYLLQKRSGKNQCTVDQIPRNIHLLAMGVQESIPHNEYTSLRKIGSSL